MQLKKNLIEIYALAVCFVTIICVTIVLGFFINDIVQLTYPEFTLGSYTINQHSSNEKFIESRIGNKHKELTDEEITKLRKKSFANVIQNEKREALQILVILSIFISIGIILFYIHWILARRARIAANNSD